MLRQSSEIRLQGNLVEESFYLLQEKESKLLCLQEQKGEYIMIFILYSIQRTTKVSC